MATSSVEFSFDDDIMHRQIGVVALGSSLCGVSKGNALRLRLTGSVVQPRVSDDLLTYKAIGSNYLSIVVTSMLVFHIATG